MSKDLVDADVFTPAIHVPEGTDSRDDAAGDVELLAQGLANRTRNLKNRVDPLDADAARKSQSNTFTEPQIINISSGEPDTPLITTTQRAGDYVPNPANRWKLVFAFPSNALAFAGIYVGQPPDGAAFTNNARWHLGTQTWRQLDPALPSTGFIGRSGQYTVSFVPAGVASWVDWPNDSGGDLLVGGNIGARLEFVYLGGGAHAKSDWTVPLASGSGELFLQADGSYKVGPGGGAWPLKIPGGVSIGTVRAVVNQATTSASLLTLVRRSKGDLALGAFPSWDPVIASNSSTLVGVQVITLPAGAGITIDGDYEYSLVWKRGHADDMIGRIGVQTWNDPGPRNLG